ncbi:hypothetical protein [Pseudomonas amygdali]|uniref:hypothetical protein n=1 Tax=Pseudomonas amygdali TaxID=47877 RepID=UPI001C577AEE|nr:hypothetical protein [Pseudomonas amygdali]QXW42671.1 hypothetical protein KXJ79_12965 [Pseudomonas amygdali]
MEIIPRPCFETLTNFKRLDSDTLDHELSVVVDFLGICPPGSQPVESYLLVKQFLANHAEPTRYNNYRTCTERLLLWSLLVAKKPITDLAEFDVQAFMEFCTSPIDSWIASKNCKRFTTGKHPHTVGFNPEWSPFYLSQSAAEENGGRASFLASRGVLAMQMSVTANFFSYLHDNDRIAVNPAYRLHRAGFYAPSLPVHTGSHIFTDEEFSVLMSTLSELADGDVKQERILLTISSIYYLRLQPSEIDQFGENLTFSALRLTADGSYDLAEDQFPGKSAWKIHPDFVENYVNRYRGRFGRTWIPLEDDHTLLLGKNRGSKSISSGYARFLFRNACQHVIDRLHEDGCVVPPILVFVLLACSGSGKPACTTVRGC